MKSPIKGHCVIEHDEDGNIHQILIFPKTKKGKKKAKAFAKSLILEYFDTERDEIDQTPSEAIKEFKKKGVWKGFSAAVTLKTTR